MASGGMPYSKKDSKQRSNWQRSTSYSDRDDAHSLNSVPNDVRINNWDFSDWRPNSQSVDVKRRKKSKGNPEREREQSLSLDSPPHREGEKKQRTPSTFPRTRITPSTPTQQRVALENLRQQLTFSDMDDQCSTDGEPNNERLLNTRKRHGSNYSRRDAASQGDSTHGGSDKAAGSHREVRSNRNNNRDDTSLKDAGPDSNQIVGRLMQIRDYIKQANSMMDNLRKRGDPGDLQKARKLSQVITSLKEQELTSMDNLQKLWKSCKEDLEKLKTLIDNLKEQERGYMGLLQRTLAIRDDGGLLENGTAARAERDGGEKRDSDDTASLELDVDTDASETTENTQSSSSRPRIEDKLGVDTDGEESGESNTSLGESENMDNTVIPGRPGRGQTEWMGVEDTEMNDNEASTARQGELESLRRQEELLKILVDKQEQLKMLQERQETLLTMKSTCEKKLAVAAASHKAVVDTEAKVAALQNPSGVMETGMQDDMESKSNIVGYPESEAEDDVNGDLNELVELRRHLNLLKNELRDQPTEGVEPEGMSVGEQLLQDKLRDLQDKKQRMDSLLKELQGLRTYRMDLMNENENEDEVSEDAAPLTIPPLPEIDLTNVSPEGAQQLEDAQEKLTKLREVRERLNQLRDLVSYYQTVKGENGEGEGADQSSQAAYSDFGQDIDPEAMLVQLLQQLNPEASSIQEMGEPAGGSQPAINLPPGQPDEHSDEENASDTESNKDSQLSSLGPWGDDPEIQEKVQKLRAAKEKLRQLQDIVAMVQQSPNGVPEMPEGMMELAASEEGEAISQVTQPNEHNLSVSEGEVVGQEKDQREEAMQMASMQQQRDELLSLREERERLMAVHSALQSLQEQFEMAENEEPVPKRQGKEGRGQPSQPMVTFASNDELYSKMRKQRILREELRQKKKELEAIMRKDRNKKQYFRNQDNHSDTVSYSTDAFAASASADATMATWGGSTVDNLGSITEDEDGNDPEAAQEDDDGFPSDGIVQVEEEEEENDSDGTYTIEEDARQRRSERSRRTHGEGARPKLTKASIAAGAQGCPRPMRKQEDGTRPKQSTRVVKKKVKVLKRDRRIKQENYRSAEEIVQEEEQTGRGLGVLQQQLERTSQMCQALLLDQQSVSPSQGMMSPSGFAMGMRGGGLMPDMLQQQLQQQQLTLCLNQCYQQLAVQQGEMQTIQQQLHSLTLQVADSYHPAVEGRDEQRPSPQYASRVNTPMTTSNSTIPNSTTASFNMHSTRQTSFTLNPQFPSTFSYHQSGARQSTPYGVDVVERRSPHADPRSTERPAETHINNLRPVPPPRIDSYLQSDDRSYLNQQPNNRTSDGSRGPRLNLQDMLNSRKAKQRTTATQSSLPESGASQYSTQNPTDRTGRYRPGLSSGISGAGFHDGQSLSSIMSARMSETGQSRNLRDGEASGGDLSLFEALRETIYSEVATLISQNENRPHFLIELFRILQVLNSDLLRQRGLYAIQELVSHTLTEDNSDSFAAPPPPWMTAAAGNCTPSELTPSESLATSDGEEVKPDKECTWWYFQARLRERVAMAQRSKRPGLLMEVNGSLKNDSYDYAEKVENTSSQSTPSNSLWDSPFAQDSLGDTVIHFDKALEKMREYEKMKNESERGAGGSESSRGREGRLNTLPDHLQPSPGSANMDQGSESSMSDMPYPRIDTNQLDQQIKSIMTEIIPVIKEHMDDACSPQLLAYIKRLVLSLTRQHDNGQEFARFFHRQLGSILQDSMAKFEGRKMRECGEEMLVDMSEVLFNELAFFRLMQDLDEPAIADKICTNTWFQTSSEKPMMSSKKVAALVGEEESECSEGSTLATDDDQVPSNLRMTATEEEELGKDRDDELATEMPIQDAEEKDEDPESPYKAGGGVQIELAVSETKPFTRIGSDEDEDEADESQSMEDPSETAVSRDNKLEHSQPAQEEGEGAGEEGEVDVMDVKVEVPDLEEKDADTQQTETSEADGTVTGGAASPVQADQSKETAVQAEGQVNGEVQMNGDINSDELTVDDLPAAITVCSSANLEQKLEEEQRLTSGTTAIMVTMETESELVGNDNTLKEPDSSV